MQSDKEINDIISKISNEITIVKNHVSDAKYSLNINNYSDALYHLDEAEKTSTCSYCKQKVKEIIFEIEYNKNICNINSKQCMSNKEEILQSISIFYNKLPDIESIKKQKAINSSQSQDFDIVGGVVKTFGGMAESMGKMWGSMFKF